MLMHCAGNRSRPNRYHALFFKAAQARCHYPGFACMNAVIFLRKLGMMAECFWECVKHLARRTVCMCVRFGRGSTPRFNSASCDCDYGKRPTIVLLCAGCSPAP